MAEVLYGIVADYAGLQGWERVYDLYCGIGTIALTLAPRAGEVWGIELVHEAVADAIAGAERNEITNARFFAGDARLALRELIERAGRPDVLVVDPPRAGLSKKVVHRIIEAGPRRIVYVSCNPTTLAPNAAELVAAGYALQRVQPVDMFPQTHHIECVAASRARRGASQLDVLERAVRYGRAMAAVGGRAMAMAAAALLAAVLLGAFARADAARAEQDIFSAYPELLTRTHPAPLLATFLPPALGPAGALELNADPEGGALYSMTYNRIIPAAHEGLFPKLAADMAVKLLPARSLAAEKRQSKRLYRLSSATVRGHPGLLFRAKHGTTTGYLWAEGGHVYEIATATPHTLSLAELLATSQTLGHLQSDLFGQDTIFTPGQTIGAGAVLLVTDVAVIANVNWTAPCTERATGFTGREEWARS